MKNLLFLILLIGCTNAPKQSTPDNPKTGTVTSEDITANKYTYTNLKAALLNPDKVIVLSLIPSKEGDTLYDLKHLPAQIGTLINLKELEIACLDNLEDLPDEIGNLKSLEKLIIDNGNGCSMNITIPPSIGKLSNLKELNLSGALDPRFTHGPYDTTEPIKELPQTISNLQNLEVLDLSRNGLKEIPPPVFVLHKLKVLRLDYNNITTIPSSISQLTNLKELNISLNATAKLPESIKALKGLKVNLAYETLDEPTNKELADQKKLQEEFPNIDFSYSYLDD